MATEPAPSPRRRSSIVTRITLVSAVLVLISAVLSGWLVYHGSSMQLVHATRADMRHTLQLAAQRVQAFSSTMSADIDFLGTIAPIADLALLADTLDSSATANATERAALLLEGFLRSRPEYAQVRVIAADSSGMERIRFDRVDGRVLRTPDSLLQAKGDRDYYKASIGLEPGERYFSRMDLNKEHGGISLPVMPTIRAAAAVRSPRGTRVGIVIINADLRPLFSDLMQLAPADGVLMLADDRGELLLHRDTALTFRFDRGGTSLLRNVLVGVSAEAEGSSMPRQGSIAEQLEVPVADMHQGFTLAMEKNTDTLLAGMRAERDRNMLAVGGVALIGVLISLLFARGIAARLARLTQRVERYATGSSNEALPVERADEIGRLARSVQHMQQRIDARLHDLEQARDRAQRAERAQQEFLANMSHELRTPLNAIIGMGNDIDADALTAPDRQKLEIVQRSAQRMRGLVDDLLDHARIADGRVVLESKPYDPTELLRDLLAVHLPPASAKGLALIADIGVLPERCTGDALRVHQVVDNLLGNAIKFTRSGQVKLTARWIAGDAPVLEMAVSDTGPGIAHDEQGRVFGRFERAAASDGGAVEGEGLGLAITHALVKAMQGSIELRSVSGEGSVFTCRIPAARADGGLPEPERQAVATPGLRVLYVEDVATNRILLQNWAGVWQWNLVCAASSEEALAACGAGQFDLLLIDLDLGSDMHGTELGLRIRGLARHRYIPMIAVTAFVDDEQAARIWKSGMNDRITKPIDRSGLLNKAAFWTGRAAEAGAPDLERLAEQYAVQGEKLIALLQQFRKEFAKHRVAAMIAAHANDVDALRRVRHQLRPQLELMRMEDGIATLDRMDTAPEAEWMQAFEGCMAVCDRAMLVRQRELQALPPFTA
ncbi:MAG: ATP-binding protein [Flavobacteriales bacterium]